MKFVNLTPHALVIHHSDEGTQEQTLPKSETPARVATVSEIVKFEAVCSSHDCANCPFAQGFNGGCSVTAEAQSTGEIEGLPCPEAGTFYIVSRMVAEVAWSHGRADVLAPGKLIRDDDGRPIGAMGFVVNPSI